MCLRYAKAAVMSHKCVAQIAGFFANADSTGRWLYWMQRIVHEHLDLGVDIEFLPWVAERAPKLGQIWRERVKIDRNEEVMVYACYAGHEGAHAPVCGKLVDHLSVFLSNNVLWNAKYSKGCFKSGPTCGGAQTVRLTYKSFDIAHLLCVGGGFHTEKCFVHLINLLTNFIELPLKLGRLSSGACLEGSSRLPEPLCQRFRGLSRPKIWYLPLR
jgi:hypothetical protein